MSAATLGTNDSPAMQRQPSSLSRIYSKQFPEEFSGLVLCCKFIVAVSVFLEWLIFRLTPCGAQL